MSAKEPRSVTIGFSTSQLNDAGIDDGIDDNALANIIDDFILTFSREFAESVRLWIEEHEEENE